MGPIESAWQYPLFEALYGRRSRRFGLGFEIAEGPLPFRSTKAPLPLSELEEALLVGAGVGVTGAPLWDMARPAALAAGLGRPFGSPTGGRRTALFFTNDQGVHVVDPNAAATKVREIETPTERDKVLAGYRARRRTLRAGRLDIPRRVPPFFGHNLWDSNQPGSTLFMPICDLSVSVIALLLQLVDGDVGRFVAGHGGGFYVVDDRQGFRPAGIERWAARGFLDREKVLPLSLLERQAGYFMLNEPAIICQNIFLATEALGLGGWMHCGFLSAGILEALGFERVAPERSGSPPHPVGLHGVFEAFCPPFFPSMDAAVDAVAARLARRGPSDSDRLPQPGPAPYTMLDAQYRDAIVEVSDEGVACTKAICNYIHDTYGRFPATTDAMQLGWLMQVHHLDLDFYDRYFKPGACGPTHREHLDAWHGPAR